MNNKQLLDLEKAWYTNAKVRYQIIKYTKDRETALITPSWAKQTKRNIRTIRVHNTQHFDTIYKWIRPYENKTHYQYYASLAKYAGGICYTSLNHEIRRKQAAEWRNTHWESMTEYDFLLDIDSPSHLYWQHALETTKEIQSLFSFLKIPHYVRWSGNGFHLLVPGRYMTITPNFNPHSENITTIYKQYMMVADALKEKYSEMIDSGIFDARRVAKIPYTLALYGKKAYVCLPLTQSGLASFTPEKALPESVVQDGFRNEEIICPDNFYTQEGQGLTKLFKHLGVE